MNPASRYRTVGAAGLAHYTRQALQPRRVHQGARRKRDIATSQSWRAWSREFPGCNWRMVCEGSGVWGLDVDAPSEDHAADGVAALASLVKQHGPIPPRPMTRSGGGGYALFFRHRGEPIHGATGWPVPGIDPRRGRLSVTVPPSIHIRTRRPYAWVVAPWELSPPDAPGWLLKAVAPPPDACLRGLSRVTSPTPIQHAAGIMPKLHCGTRSAALPSAPGGQRNDILNRQTFSLARLDPYWRSDYARDCGVHGRCRPARRSGCA